MTTTPNRPWLQSYPEGVPATVEPTGTLVDLLFTSTPAARPRCS
jgi:hypothetical protein